MASQRCFQESALFHHADPAVLLKSYLFQGRATPESVLLDRVEALRNCYLRKSALLKTPASNLLYASRKVQSLQILAFSKRVLPNPPKLGAVLKLHFPQKFALCKGHRSDLSDACRDDHLLDGASAKPVVSDHLCPVRNNCTSLRPKVPHAHAVRHRVFLWTQSNR